MSKSKVLITGGAGFIGSHLADELLAHGYEVRVLDNITRRVHGSGGRPPYLDREVELLVGDVRDGAAVERALEDVEVVVHLAGAVGAGESVFEVDRCMSVNNVGTAVLLDRLVRSSVERFVVGSSMAIYGEGLYREHSGAPVDSVVRTPEQLRRGAWAPRLEGRVLIPVATPESKAANPITVYARSKYDQERMCLRFGRAFGLPTLALRFFHVFGPRQGLSNPYTGDLVRFATRLIEGRCPRLSEDGQQTRDYVSVRDVASACRRALETPFRGAILNIGSGRAICLSEIAQRMAAIAGKPTLLPEVTGEHVLGEVRSCFADVSRAEQVLGPIAASDLDTSLAELMAWTELQMPSSRPMFESKVVDFGMGVAP